MADTTPYYKCKPKTVLDNHEYKVYYDRTILTEESIGNNRTDIVLVDKTKKQTFLIVIAVPNTYNVKNTIQENIHNYTDLKIEVAKIWKMDKVHMVPIILSSTGIIPKNLLENGHILNLNITIIRQLQKAVISNTCRTVRTFLYDY